MNIQQIKEKSRKRTLADKLEALNNSQEVSREMPTFEYNTIEDKVLLSVISSHYQEYLKEAYEVIAIQEQELKALKL